MKPVSFLIAIMLLALSINSNAQLNYLLSASSKPYVPVEGGVAPHLIMVAPTNANPPWTLQDEGFAQVPIGFTFNYNGKEYDSATVCANGFVTLGDTMFRRLRPLSLYRNFLASGPFPVEGIKPVLAPFWDDLDIVDTLNLVYKTTGHAPFRVFTVEWKKTKWTFESTEPGLSMELKLYEKTNVIEFHYRDEGGTPFTSKAFASIGITSSYDYRGFISLQNASSNPSISLLRANDSITTKPASNQVYTFTPSTVNIPELVINSKFYSDQSAGYKLKSNGPGHLEYAISNSAIPPVAGIEIRDEDILASNLSPATTYYIYGRAIKNNNFYSQWTCDSFKTAVTPLAVPYHISGNPNIYPYWPPDIRIQDMNDTARGHYPNSDAVWNVITDFPDYGDTSIWALNTLYRQDADSWLFTPGLKLSIGKSYQLKFGYISFPTQVPGEISSFEVKYGDATGAVAMTSGTLFKRDDIVTDFDFAPMSFEDTTIEITPDHSGVYYFGFHNLTKLNNGQPGPVPVISNILVSETGSLTTPFVLTGKTNNTDNVLNMKIDNHKKAVGLVMQRSIDGINFTKIGDVPVQTLRKNSSAAYATFKIHRNTHFADGRNNEGKDSRILDEGKSRFELQRSDDGINLKKPNASTSKSDKTNVKNNYDYVDHNTKGINYYRLQLVDKNGAISYSNIVTLNNTLRPGIKAYPNPAQDVMNVTIPSGTNKLTLLITDISGRTVLDKVIQRTKGGNIEQLDISHLTPGIYSLKLKYTDGTENPVIKFVKQ